MANKKGFDTRFCNNCPIKNDCALMKYDEGLRSRVCAYISQEQRAKADIEEQIEGYYKQALKQLKDENFDANYCQSCAICNECALMKFDEKLRQYLCLNPLIKQKDKAELDSSLLTPLTKNQLN